MANFRLYLFIFLGILSLITAQAQDKPHNIFNHLDVGVTVGTTGLGFELGSPVTEWAKVRIGADFTPSVDIPLHFGITAYSDGKVNTGNFEKIRDIMDKISGFEIDDQIDVNGTPKMSNFKLLVDVYPLPKNRHWHLTLGFYAGPKRIGNAINAMREMPSLLAIGIYNRLYDYAIADGFIDNPIYNDIYLDPDQADMLKEKLENYGRLGIHIGDFKDGTPYYMEPDKDGTVSAKAYVNSVRYYTGAGYTTTLSQNKRWSFSVDAGVLFWGGNPKIINHEGINMSHDLVNVRGKVGDYLKFINSLKVYPVLDFKISYTIF